MGRRSQKKQPISDVLNLEATRSHLGGNSEVTRRHDDEASRIYRGGSKEVVRGGEGVATGAARKEESLYFKLFSYLCSRKTRYGRNG